MKNKRKLAAVSSETPENTRNCQSQNTFNQWMAEEYITQVSEEVEGRVTKELSQEFSRTESRILGALSKLDEFPLNPPVRTCSVALPGTSRNINSESRDPTGYRFLDNPCPKVVFSASHTSKLNDSEQEETHHMVTRVQEEIPHCSLGTSSGKQKKARSTIRPQFCSENTPAKIEADHTLLAFQQLARNRNSANFHNNINRISNLSQSLTTTMPTFDRKTQKFELFQDLI